MAIEIRHREHAYTYRHPVGWSGGERHLREKLNESRPASEYPEAEAEKMDVDHALAGILAGGEVIVPESGRHVRGGVDHSEVEDGAVGGQDVRPDRILEETGAEDHSGDSLTDDPDRILSG